MNEFVCPRCGEELDDDAEGVVVCDCCGQAVSLPGKTTPLAAAARPRSVRVHVGGGPDWWDRNWGWVFAAAWVLVGLLAVFGDYFR